MNARISPSRIRFFNLKGALGVMLLGVLAFSLNALFSARTTEIARQPRPRVSQQLSPTPTDAIRQTDPTAGWMVYKSPLGFSIKYPTTWLAGPDPAIGMADLLYESEDFLRVRKGEIPADPQGGPYFYVVIQQLTFENLNLLPTESVEELVQSMEKADKTNVGSIKVLQKEPFFVSGDKGLLRIIEALGRYQIQVHVIHKNLVYSLYAFLEDPQDLSRVEIFKKISSSLQFAD